MAKVIIRAGKVGLFVILPLIIVGLVLYVLNITLLAQETVVDDLALAPETLKIQLPDMDIEKAQVYQKDGKYTEAELIYDNILAYSKDMDLVFEAKVHKSILYLAAKQPLEAANAYLDLKTACLDIECIETTVKLVAYDCMRLKENVDAFAFFEYMLSDLCSDCSSIWIDTGYILCDLFKQDDAKAASIETALANLLIDSDDDPAASEAICLVAWQFRKLGDLESARELYEYIVNNHPEGNRTVYAQRGIVRYWLAKNKVELAVSEAKNIFTKFPDRDQSPAFACEMAREFKKKNLKDISRDLYQQVLDNYPENENAVVANAELTILSLEFQDPNALDSVYEIFDFGKDEIVAKQAIKIADFCRKNKKTDAAKGLYAEVLKKFPKTEHAMWSQAGLTIVDVIEDDPNSTESNFDELITNYSEYEDYDRAIFHVSDAHYIQGFHKDNEGKHDRSVHHFNKAIEKWHMIIEQVDAKEYIHVYSNMMAGECYRALDLDQAALVHYTEVATKWPKSEHAPKAHMLIGASLDKLTRQGKLTKDEAIPLIENAYRKVIQEYPDDKVSKFAQKHLDRLTAREGGVK